MKQYMAKQIYPEEVIFLTHDPEDEFNKTTQLILRTTIYHKLFVVSMLVSFQTMN